MLTAIGERARLWAATIDPWTNVYGLARTMLALATATTLAASESTVLFAPPSASAGVAPMCIGLRAASAFCVAPSGHLDLVRWACIAALLVVASGWRPRITGPLHWWISFSLQASASILDGGDHITEMLTLLLLPITLTDARTWHWSAPRAAPLAGAEEAKRIVALVTFTVIRIQVAGVYFHAAAGKFAADTWADGTSLYYWLTSPDFGAPSWLMPIVRPLMVHPVSVALLTWGVVMLEFGLAAGLVIAKKHWRVLLVAGLALHGGIILLHGLVSFGIAMMAALVLFLRPIEQPFHTHLLERMTTMKKRVEKKFGLGRRARGVAWAATLLVTLGAGAIACGGEPGTSTTAASDAPAMTQAHAMAGEEAIRGVFFGQGAVAGRLPDIWQRAEIARGRDAVSADDVDAIIAGIRGNAPDTLAHFGADVASGDYLRVRAALLGAATQIKVAEAAHSASIGRGVGERLPPMVCLIAMCWVIVGRPETAPTEPGLTQDAWVRYVGDSLAASTDTPARP